MKFKVKKSNDIKINKIEIARRSQRYGDVYYNSELNTFYKLYIKSSGTSWDTYELMKFDFKRNEFKFADVGSLTSIMKKLPDDNWYRATATEIKEPEAVLPSPICKEPKFSFASYIGNFRVELSVLASQIAYFDENKNEMSTTNSTLFKLDEVDAIRCKAFCLRHKIKVIEKPEPIEYQILTLPDGTKFKVKETDIIGHSSTMPNCYCEIVFNLNGVRFDLTTNREYPGIKFEHVTEKGK